MKRLESLDWLRGLLAVSIMLYHLTGWKLHQPDASEPLGRLGIYGVSMFLTLSGLSMAAGYSGFVRDGRSAFRFFVRRIFRIWPPLWIAVAAVTFGEVALKAQEVDWLVLLLNVTTLFGFISPGSYINTGAWSIGNEMVYYALTPVLLATYDHKLLYGNVIIATTMIVGLYFGFEAIHPQATLASQCQTYINSMNNLFLYAAGVALYYNASRLTFNATVTSALLLASMVIFLWYPVSGDLVHIVTGVPRIVFALASILLVLSFYKVNSSLPAWISRLLVPLGVATYGVYLLHPIVFQTIELCFRKLSWNNSAFMIISLTIMLTVVISMVIYARIESPLIRLGKQFTGGGNALSGRGKT